MRTDTMDATLDQLIITGCSESYRDQLLALLGSLRCNWPNHPPVLIYDLGLGTSTLNILTESGFRVRTVPAFVPHWRKHYTWKLWCMNDAPGQALLWLDSGCCVLRPLPEIFEIIEVQGYFALPNYFPLELEASEQACEGCQVPFTFAANKVSLAANVFGFKRDTIAETVTENALRVAMTERNIQATSPHHRHDQALLALLMHRDIRPLILCDGTIYAWDDLHANFTTHAIWAVRRGMHPKDKRFLACCLTGHVLPFRPRPSHKVTLWYRTAWRAKTLLDAVKQSFKRKRFTGNGNGLKD